MGGGDLNLKKSWHPHTMKNQERVWKAEQTKSEEEKKLKDLRKEIEEEKTREELKRIGENSGVLHKSDGDKKLEWMYKNSNELINREEYLLGRKIDKSFEVLQAEEADKQKNVVGVKQAINPVEHECIPFSIRSYRGVETSEQVDLQRKVMEDPLMLIKQKEMESRRKLLENPVKLKELHRILKTDQFLQKNVKKSKKSKKKRKKRSKSSESSASSGSETDSDDNLDRKLAKQYKKLKGKGNDSELGDLSLMKLLESKYDTISKELDRAADKKKKKKHKNNRRSSDSDSSDNMNRKKNETTTCDRDRDRDNERERNRNRDRTNREKHFSSDSRSTPANRQQKINRRSSDRRDNDQRSSHRSTSGRSPNYREMHSRSKERTTRNQHNNSSSSRQHDRYKRSRSRENQRRTDRRRSRSRSPVLKSKDKWSNQQRSPKYTPKTNEPTKTNVANKKLSDDEKQARLREMMANAAWREDDRSKAVKKHREAYEREEQQNRTRDYDKDFINKQVKLAIDNQTSVGSRIRSNLNNIQRSATAMDTNFARK